MRESIKNMDENTLIDDVRFVIVDVETTGLNPLSDRICEIAFIETKSQKIINKFSTLINPNIPIPRNVSAIHRIYDEDVLDAPSFSDIANMLVDVFYDSVLVGHNISFDFEFINSELKRIGMKMPDVKMIDTLALSRRFLLNQENNTLRGVAKSINLNLHNWHRALADVEVTKKIFDHFLLLFVKESGIKTLGDLMRIVG